MNALYRELDESQQKMIQSPGDGAEPIDSQKWFCADGERRDDD